MVTSDRVDTIAAIATPPGRGGIGVVRVSGPLVTDIMQQVLRRQLSPRVATCGHFFHPECGVVDEGLGLFFKGPASFTGEDVLELQGHGGSVVLQQVLQATLLAGARLAEPGEFSQRAFLNNKIDLTQAEAIADLIDAGSVVAARSALRSLQGVFSDEVNALVKELVSLRMFVESAIDFPDEDIEFIESHAVVDKLHVIRQQLQRAISSAQQGVLLRDGMQVVLAGRPNAGKSSLLNALAGDDVAIVTPVAGTTRDVLREHLHLDGMPLHVMDTAGLRETADQVEQEGVKRARKVMEAADMVLLVVDVTELQHAGDMMAEMKRGPVPVQVIFNKCDLLSPADSLPEGGLPLSTVTGAGLAELKKILIEKMGYSSEAGTGMARERHVHALMAAAAAIDQGVEQLQSHQAGELLAQDLLEAQHYLNRITGEFTSDDLLGEIFSSFCIGK